MELLWPLVIAVVLLFLLLWLGYTRGARISGFGPHVVKQIETFEYPGDDEESGQPEKRSITTETQGARTVWEWLTILTISTVIAGAALWFSTHQADQQKKIQVRQANDAQDLQIQQANDEALQSYLDQMSTLLIEHDLRTSPEGSEARTLARSRTLTILSRLDPRRRSRVLQFLLEAELVQRIEQTTLVFDLSGANPSGITVPTKNPVIDLSGANLSGVFVPADTDLSFADLSGADLSEANLSTANISTAYLTATNLHNANLSRATLSYSDLGLADLRGANLSDVDLTLANLQDADLTNADLTGADLWQADLSDAKGVTEKTLAEQAGYVGDTTMPEGHTSGVHTTGTKWGEYPSGKLPPGIPGMSIRAGEYDSDEFVPAFHFEVGKGWQGQSSEETDYMSLGVDVRMDPQKYISETSDLIVTNPLSIFNARNWSDARTLSELETLPAPENADEWASWFQEHPNLETSEPKPVSVGGAPGIQIDVTDVSLPENFPEVPIFVTNLNGLVVNPERKERFLIVDVGEETVVINLSVPPDKSQEFLSKAQNLLDTMEWTGV
jgi:Pentapeptide repeats (8 copies)